MQIPSLKRGKLPRPPEFFKMVGPSFILLGLGLGSGELILWPYMTANYGLGIIWGAVMGITMQWFINMEISRYTLATGESVFVGLSRKLGKIIPIWFLISTLIPWMWPGIALVGAKLLVAGLGWGNVAWVSGQMLIVIGFILSLGPILYGTQEKMQKILLVLGLPFVLGLSWWLSSGSGVESLAWGIVGKGDGYWFFPAGVQLSAFLAAIAFSGAGGNLNLGQSQNIKEKGYGMSFGSGRITSLLTGKREEIELSGKDFEINKDSLTTFNQWWRMMNWEQGIIFWLTGMISIVSLALLAFETIYGKTGGMAGVDFILAEARHIGSVTSFLVERTFLVVLGLTLFATQLSVTGTTAKIMAENWAILKWGKDQSKNLPKYFYTWLWIQIGLMLVILGLGFKEPLQLVLISAVMNSWSMLVYSGLVLWLNVKILDPRLSPGFGRKSVILGAMTFLTVLGVLALRQLLS